MSMKILLLLSAGKDFRKAAEQGKPYTSYAPTTLIHLAALVPGDYKAEVKTADLGVSPMPELDADLIGISTITCGADEAYSIADRARKKRMTVVLGGSHPTAMPEEALQHADAVVSGYAEKTWPLLLKDFKAGRLRRLYIDDKPGHVFTAPPLNRALLGKGKYLFTHCLETTRGCPNHCDFCVISNSSSGCTTREIRDVVTEIETMGKQVLFLDSNHTEFPAYNHQLWNELKNLKKKWFCAGSLRFLANKERLHHAAECGLKGILVGFESVSQNSLEGIRKTFNRVRDYKEIIQRVHDLGILVFGCFIFGFDGDDKDIFEKTVEFVDAVQIDIVRYGFLTPFPGTPLFHTMEQQGRILTRDWGLYDTDNIVFKPLHLSPEKLMDGLHWAYRETYKLSSIVKRIKWTGFTTLYSVLGNLGFRRMRQGITNREV